MKNRITTGLLKPKGRPLSFMTVMICPDSKCGHVWKSSTTGGRCPKCGNPDIVPADKWELDTDALLVMGKLPAILPKKKGARHGE